MHYASLENITKSYGIRVLFRDISLHIEEGDKVALIARNGTGKSTLLKIIAGKEQPDSGTVWIHKDIKVVMLEQDTRFQEGHSVWDHVLRMDHPTIHLIKEYEQLSASPERNEHRLAELITAITEANAWNLESQLKQILGKLQIYDLDSLVQHLSGGQRKRVALAQVLLEAQLHEGKCLLILDEPTNHLDVDMIEWLEEFLSTQNTTLLLVTHDRYFLDAVCSEIVELDEEQTFTYKGNYDYFLEQKALRREVQQSELQKDKNIYRRELEWMRRQPQARTTKSRSRQDAFYDLKEKVTGKEIQEDITLQVKMTRLGGKIIEMKKVYKSFGDKVILKGFDYTFKRGERIGVVGRNGSGKSTFLKIALGLMEPDSGKINHGETVVFGNFSQEGLQYKEDKRAIEYVKQFAEFFPLADGNKISASQFMEKFGFNGQQQYTPLSKLSGGEKRRLLLLSILFRNPNFLVLDEPTNDLDLQTLRVLEEFLADFQGCLLIVSHDRYFMDRLVDHIFAFEGDGKVIDYPGNYTQYRLWKQQTEQKEEVAEKKVSEPVKTFSQKNPNRLSYKEKREYELLEKELPKLEKEKSDLEARLSEGNLPFDELTKISERIGELANLIDEKEMRWLELNEIENPS
ncbi:MAG: ABC-F family ATP-binding cassette domain-containing protein [Chitinophagaceae bacterium]|nr:ABC-F family ATP-binding cassette domain-containing protein [Chitinophagaceae bacterium]MCZ2396319.1 ABC-F family ATP-binding cassette domain-containing protein [Chitinophagales bacterium]